MLNSIAGRLIGALTLFSTVIIGAGLSLDYRLSRDEILERVRLESRDTVNATITDLDNWLDGVEGSARFLGQILSKHEFNPDELAQLLRDIVSQSDDVIGATIALNPELVDNPLGFAPYYYWTETGLAAAELTAGQNPYWERAWFKDAVEAGGPIWVEPYFDAEGARVLMTTYSVPVYRAGESGQPRLYGVVTADVALDELHQYLQRLQLGESGFGILMSRSGVLLSSPGPDDAMRHHQEVIEDPQGRASWQEMFDAALTGQTTSRDIDCRWVPGNCVVRMSAMRSTGWPVGVVYSSEELLAPLRDYQYKASIAGAATIFVMMLVVALVSRRITKPLAALATSSDRIARGELSAPLPRVEGKDEVARLVRAYRAMQSDLKTYIADLEQATASRSRLEGELTAAREIQMSMLPGGGEAAVAADAWTLWASVRPARLVGGDLYTYHVHGRRLVFVVGDVSDKGVPAALFMARAISLIQQHPDSFEHPGRGIARLNNALCKGNDSCMFLTLFCGVLDLDSLELCFASAGHHPPVLGRDMSYRVCSQDAGPALGLAPDLEYHHNTVQLRSGDRLAVYTDGIDEAFNEQGEQYGHERFRALLAESTDRPLSEVGRHAFAAIDEFAGDVAQSDDITVLLLELPLELVRQQQAFPLDDRLTAAVHAWLESALGNTPLNETANNEMLLVAEEVVSNIHKYSGLGQDDSVNMIVSSSAEEVSIRFSDSGIPFNPMSDRGSELGVESDSAAIGGLGVHLIWQLTDHQAYCHQDGHNVLTLGKNVELQD